LRRNLKRGWHRCGLPPTAWICSACQNLNVAEPNAERACDLCHPSVPLIDRLQRARTRAGLAVGQAARLADLPREVLDRAEYRDAGLLQPEELARLAALYGVPPFVFGVEEG
jgi:hypothetical protein